MSTDIRRAGSGGSSNPFYITSNTYFTYDAPSLTLSLYVSGTLVQQWTGTGITTAILLENGVDELLLEDGSSLLLQES